MKESTKSRGNRIFLSLYENFDIVNIQAEDMTPDSRGMSQKHIKFGNVEFEVEEKVRNKGVDMNA